MAKSDVVRVGFVGVGGIAGVHLKFVSAAADAKIVAVCDVNPAQLDKIATQYGAKAYGDTKKMLDSEQLDAVYVCVPPFAHTDQELLVCERKLGLFVEKPLTTTLEKGEEILAAAKKAGNVTAVGYNWRSCEITKKAKELIGKKPVSAAFGYWVGGMPGVMWWRKQAESGGQLNEQATHVVDIARHLIGGKVVSVYAQGSKGILNKKHEKHDVHENAIALLTFDNGCVCTIATGHLCPQGFRVGIDFVLEDSVVTHNNSELRVKHPKGEEIYRNTNDAYGDEDRAFIDAVKNNNPAGVFCTYADAFETHRITMAANKSMETGKVVSL
jgi:myo-inositol 2-dehydrogenase/D-chiro-inositol 1-dehydrogenase